MEKLKLYEVTKPSSDGSFKIGDLIWLSENGDLNNAMAGGWMSKDEWNMDGMNDFECEISKKFYLDVSSRKESVKKIS